MKYKPLFLSVALFFIASYCFAADGRIMGSVNDIFGDPIKDVSIQIENSGFETTTDKSGKYALDYIPSEFTIIYFKDGYTTDHLKLNIHQKANFPAKKITLSPKPIEEGVFYVDFKTKQLHKLIKGKQEAVTKDERFFHSYVNIANIMYQLPSGKVTFIDNYPDKIAATKVDSQGFFHTAEKDFFIRSRTRNFIEDKKEKIGTGNNTALLRTVVVEPGHYAWVDVTEDDNGNIGIVPNKDKFVFPFTVFEDKEPELSRNEHLKYIFDIFEKVCMGKTSQQDSLEAAQKLPDLSRVSDRRIRNDDYTFETYYDGKRYRVAISDHGQCSVFNYERGRALNQKLAFSKADLKSEMAKRADIDSKKTKENERKHPDYKDDLSISLDFYDPAGNHLDYSANISLTAGIQVGVQLSYHYPRKN